MIKSKSKFLLLLVISITLVSTLSFATVEPRTSDESNIMPISETAENTISEDTVNMEKEPEWVNSDLYVADGKYELNKIVDGNVYIIADEVVISGEVGGNVFVFANKLTIEGGYIYSALYAIANEITINGIVYDVYTASNVFNLGSDSFIYRDIKAIASTFNIDGKVRRDAYLSGNTFNFSSENGALIGGNLEYSSNSEIEIPEDIVTGKVTYTTRAVEQQNVASIVFSYIFSAIDNLVYTFVLILLALWLAPKFTNRVSTMNTRKSFICFGIGTAASIITIIVLIALLFSALTSMLFATTFMFIVIFMSGVAFSSIYFGSLFIKLVKWDGKVKFVLSSLVASLIIWAISQIPYVGIIFNLLVSLFGIGILLVNVIYKKDEQKCEVVQEVKETENTEEFKKTDE